MSKTKKSMYVIIELLFMISIMFSVLCICLKVNVLNKNTYTNILEKSDAYNKVTELVYGKIDAALSAKNINYDIKESIITEDDIKRESDSAIIEVIDYLKTGKNDIKPIDTEIYKKRVSDVVHSTISNIIKPANNNLSFDYNSNIKMTSNNSSKYKVDKIIVKDKYKVGQDSLKVEKLMSRNEAEAKVREILKQKGLTEEQAIDKAQKKGLTEEQALKILAGYGITIDDEPEKNKDNKENSDEDRVKEDENSSSENTDSSEKGSNKITESSDKDAESKSQEGPLETNKNTGSQLDMIENKLINEADNNIEEEVEKVDLNKILSSNKFQKLTIITSVIYKIFWLFIILPFIFMAILIKINRKKIVCGLKQIGRAFFSAGLILSVIFIGAYVFKIYERVNIGPVYFKEITSYAIKCILIKLSMYGVAAFVMGLLILIPIIIKEHSSSYYIK